MTDPDQLKSDADTAFRAGRLADARALYEEALRARPDWVAVHNNLAMALRALGAPMKRNRISVRRSISTQIKPVRSATLGRC